MVRVNLAPWLFLLAAVVSEIVGVATMKLVSQEDHWGGFLLMYFMIGMSFAFLAMAMKHLSMAVAYATWETLGLVAITFIGYLYFEESLGAVKVLGMIVLIAGVILVNFDSPPGKE
ncbi:DMT family transporter [Pseudomonas sp. MDT1-17]